MRDVHLVSCKHGIGIAPLMRKVFIFFNFIFGGAGGCGGLFKGLACSFFSFFVSFIIIIFFCKFF